MKDVYAMVAAMLLCVASLQAQFVTNGEVSQIVAPPQPLDRCGVTVFPRYDINGTVLDSPAFGTNVNLATPVGWASLRGTPDLYLECFAAPVVVPVKEEGVRGQLELPDLSPDGKEGGFIGMWVANDYREYVQNELVQRLSPGRRYRLTARVAVRENYWGVNSQQSNLYSLSAPRQISLLLSPNAIVANGNGPFIQWDPAASFEIVDANGHGNFGANPGIVNGGDRWKTISYEFDVPANMIDGVGYIALSPGPVNRAITANDVVGLQPNPKDEICYVYIDGVTITEVPCSCDDVLISLNQSEVVINQDLSCCFTVDIDSKRNCRISEFTIVTSDDVSFIDGARVQPGQQVFWEDPSTMGVTNGKLRSRTYCILSLGGVTTVTVALTLANGETCKRTFELNCKPCNCEVRTPRISIERIQTDSGSSVCCYEFSVDNVNGCPRAKVIDRRIFVNGEKIYHTPETLNLDNPLNLFYTHCITRGSTQNVRVELVMDLDGKICTVSEERELSCPDCCRSATVTASTPVGIELLRGDWPNCSPCTPLAVRINYAGGSLCSQNAVIVFPSGQRRAIKVPINQPAGTSFLLTLVCPGYVPYTIKVMIGGCVYDVNIPACIVRSGGDNPTLGKQSQNDNGQGDEDTYTLSVSDVRGVRYGTHTGTNIEQLFEQAKSGDMPNGFYVVYVHNSAGALVNRRFFVK